VLAGCRCPCWGTKLNISGCSLQDECYDLELYNWTKVDLSDAAQKKRVEEMIAEEAKIDGLENIECKVFK